MTKVNNFYVPKVDSLRLRVPLSEVEIIDTTLIDNLITYAESTGEVVELKKGKAYIKETPCGLQFKFWVRKRKDISQEKLLEEIYFLINSKHLKEKYFEGITIRVVDLILEALNSLNVIKISREALLNADIQDVDICFDFPATPKEFTEVLERYSEMVKVDKRDIVKPIEKRMNSIQWHLNSREYNTPSKPHTKFYHKTIELESNSHLFKDKYLADIDYKDIARFEFNLKNRRYFQYFGIDRIKTLGQLLQLSTMKRICQDVYQNWFIKREFKPISSENYHMKLHRMLISLMDKRDVEFAFNYLINNPSNWNEPKKFRTLYHTIMTPEKKKFHEANRIMLQEKLDKFFGVEKRTNDVRIQLIDSVSNQPNKN